MKEIEKEFDRLGYKKTNDDFSNILYQSKKEKNIYILFRKNKKDFAKYKYITPFNCKYSFITYEEMEVIYHQIKLLKEGK